MTTSPAIPSSSVAKATARRVRVKLRRITCNYSKPYPPDGYNKLWWDRLKAALGTSSSDFVNVTLIQIQNASRLPCGGICEMSVNAVLAFIEAAEPKNEIEAALAIQIACTHAVAMAVMSRAGGACGGDRNTARVVQAGARLLNAFANQVETLRRLRKRRYPSHSGRTDRGFRYCTSCNREHQLATARVLIWKLALLAACQRVTAAAGWAVWIMTLRCCA
jgi:hypothetical protein